MGENLAPPSAESLLSLDLLVVTPALSSVWQERERVDWRHGTLPVISRAGLVTMKRMRGSGQDLDDIRVLEEDHEKA